MIDPLEREERAHPLDAARGIFFCVIGGLAIWAAFWELIDFGWRLLP